QMETLLMIDDVSDVRPGVASGASSASIVNNAAAASASASLAVVWRADGGRLQFTDVSGNAEQMLGYPASHWLKSPAFFAQRIHKDDREAVLALYRTAAQHTRDVNAEFRAV